MNTGRIYYHDCYLRNFTAEVVGSADEGRRVYLSSTAFYPTSGGQPHDLGTLSGNPVLDVVDEGDRIAHIVAEPTPHGAVEGQINWQHRYDHMQQHTGQHLLSAVFVELFDAHTLSFHMGAEVSSIELSLNALSEAQIDQVERRANEIVWEARPVHIVFEDAQVAEGLRKPSERTGTLRIVEISGVDRSACGGTHVRSTAELGPIQITGQERIRGKIRAEFVCGGRALRYAQQEHRILTELSRTASSAVDKLPEYVMQMRDRLSKAEKENQAFNSELARRDGERAYNEMDPGSDGNRRWFQETPAIDDTVRAKVQAFTKLPKAIALVAGANPAGVLIACSTDAGLHAGNILKAALARAGGRGGGSATLAQGSLPEASVLESLKAELGF